MVAADTSEPNNFAKLDFQSKKEIIARGRPTPALANLHQQKGQKSVLSFQTDWYKRKD